MSVDEKLLGALADIRGPDGISVEEKRLRSYGRDKITEEHYAGTADVVVWPRSTEDVARIVERARKSGVPVTPRGGGSGLSGGAVPVRGGIVMAMERMNRVLEIDEENLVAVIEPGVVTKDLDRILEPYGLFFAGYPMSEEVCELGGNVAENAGGGRAVKYGVTGDYVLGLEVVTGTGEVLRLGGKRIKDVTGYDLVSLFVGSEGTLGIITEITLRLLPRPRARQAALGFLPDESSLQELIPALLRRLSARPSSIEMADATCMRILKAASRTWSRIPDGASMLLVEFNGVDETALHAQTQEAESLLEKHGGLDIHRSESEEELEELWRIRK